MDDMAVKNFGSAGSGVREVDILASGLSDENVGNGRRRQSPNLRES